MESKMPMLACGLLLMPIMANAQSPDADIAGADAFACRRAAALARWIHKLERKKNLRTGLVNIRGGQWDHICGRYEIDCEHRS
jgi:hypothetical protein